MNHDNTQPEDSTSSTTGGDWEPPGSQGRDHLSSGSRTPSPSNSSSHGQRGFPESIDINALRTDPILLAQITAYLQENHLHLPVLTPDHETMIKMKKDTPELYRAYIKALNAQIETDKVTRTYPYTEPRKMVLGAQVSGLIAVGMVLIFAGFLAFLGHPVTAGIIAGLDIVALAAVFSGSSSQRKDNQQ